MYMASCLIYCRNKNTVKQWHRNLEQRIASAGVRANATWASAMALCCRAYGNLEAVAQPSALSVGLRLPRDSGCYFARSAVPETPGLLQENLARDPTHHWRWNHERIRCSLPSLVSSDKGAGKSPLHRLWTRQACLGTSCHCFLLIYMPLLRWSLATGAAKCLEPGKSDVQLPTVRGSHRAGNSSLAYVLVVELDCKEEAQWMGSG